MDLYLRKIIIILLTVLLFSCKGEGRKSFLPAIPGYNPATKEVVVLDKELLEISGINYMGDGKLVGINDEDGKIYIINPDGSYKVSTFGRKRDYEDVVKYGDFYFVLESNGNIHRVPVSAPNSEEEFEFERKKKIEFESLYFDPSINKLMLLSKEQRESKKGILVFSFDPVTLEYSDDPVFMISFNDIEKAMKDHNTVCKPSAAAINPISNKLFVIASVGKVLIQCNIRGEVEKAYQINPSHFPQPEGICFAPNGDMYISNEGVDGKATIRKYPYAP